MHFRDSLLITDEPIDQTKYSALDLIHVIDPDWPVLQKIEQDPIASCRRSGMGRWMTMLIRLDSDHDCAPVAFLTGDYAKSDVKDLIEWFWRIGLTMNEVYANQIARYIRGPFRQCPPEDVSLSNWKYQVLAGIGDRLSTNEITDRIGISPGTVKTYRHRIRDKTDIYHEAGLVKLAIRLKLTQL